MNSCNEICKIVMDLQIIGRLPQGAQNTAGFPRNVPGGGGPGRLWKVLGVPGSPRRPGDPQKAPRRRGSVLWAQLNCCSSLNIEKRLTRPKLYTNPSRTIKLYFSATDAAEFRALIFGIKVIIANNGINNNNSRTVSCYIFFGVLKEYL